MQIIKPFAYVSTFIGTCWGCIDYGKFYSHIHGTPPIEGNENKIFYLTNLQNLLVYIYNFQIFDFLRILINNISNTFGIAYKFVTIAVIIVCISILLWIPYRIYKFWKRGKIEEDYVKEYENTFWKLIKEAFGIDNKIVALKIQEENIKIQDEYLKKNEEEVKQLKENIIKELEEKIGGWKAKIELLKLQLVKEKEEAEKKLNEVGKDLLAVIEQKNESLEILQKENDKKIILMQEAQDKQIANLKSNFEKEILKYKQEIDNLKQINFNLQSKKFKAANAKKEKELINIDDLDD